MTEKELFQSVEAFVSDGHSFDETVAHIVELKDVQDEHFSECKKQYGDKKNVKKCCQYITNVARAKAKNGSYGMSEVEMIKLVVHYFTEDIEDEKPVKATVMSSVVEPPAKPANLSIFGVEATAPVKSAPANEPAKKQAAKPKAKKPAEQPKNEPMQLNIFGF